MSDRWRPATAWWETNYAATPEEGIVDLKPENARITWDGDKVRAVADVTIGELDGVIARLQRLRAVIADNNGKLVFEVPQQRIIKP